MPHPPTPSPRCCALSLSGGLRSPAGCFAKGEGVQNDAPTSMGWTRELTPYRNLDAISRSGGMKPKEGSNGSGFVIVVGVVVMADKYFAGLASALRPADDA
jgi:hypothetical protein